VKLKRFLISTTALGAVALGVTFAACGGSDSGESASAGGTSSDETYVAAVCSAGAQFFKDIEKAQAAALKSIDDPSSDEAEKIAAKAMAEPVATFAKNLRRATAPKDVKKYHDEMVSNLDKAAKGLKDGDMGALSAMDMSDAPADVSDRLDKLASANKDCIAADFAFSE
jgi:hypothetical protein